MQSDVRRAAAFASVATVALVAPWAGALTAVPFALIAVVGRTLSEGRLFDLFARPSDRVDGQLRGLIGFTLAATALALLTSLTTLPTDVFVGTVVLVSYGNLAERLAVGGEGEPVVGATGFVVGGTLAAVTAFAGVAAIEATTVDLARALFLGICGTLVAALLRATLVGQDDPLVMLSAAAVLWLFADLGVRADLARILVSVGTVGAFGYVSWRLQTASVTGLLTGVLIALLTIVLGGYGWFAVLIAFFGLGGLVSKYRYEEKHARGIAEPNEGARGSRNVLGNASVALVAVLGFAASRVGQFAVPPEVFAFAFAGSIATAMSDTFSSEIGMLFDRPRMITSLRRVEPGTDGGVTLEGSLAGVLGAAIVAVTALAAFDLGAGAAALVLVAGVLGMFADSVFGAVLEGGVIGNQTVNFLATLTGALLCTAGALIAGLVPT